jgi:hypothetical protein
VGIFFSPMGMILKNLEARLLFSREFLRNHIFWCMAGPQEKEIQGLLV